MAFLDKEIDITRNIKTIEWLKSELLTSISSLYKILISGVKEEVCESISEILSNIILVCYILGKRLGVSYNSIEMKIEKKIRMGLIEQHDVEKHYGDLSELSKHLDYSRAKR